MTHQETTAERLQGVAAVGDRLADAADREGVARRGVDALVDLGYDAVCVRLYDEASNDLGRAATSETATELLGTALSYDLDAGGAQRAFQTDEPVSVAADAHEAVAHAHLHVPVGETAVVTLVDTTATGAASGFDDTDRATAAAVGAPLQTALARVRRDRELRSCRAELERRSRELGAANAFGALVSEAVDSVLATDTRVETEATVVERLAGTDLFEAVWFLADPETTPGEGVASPTERVRAAVAPEAFGGTETAFLDTPFAEDLLAAARSAGEVTVRQRRVEPAPDEPGPADVTAAAAVPVTTETQSFGTLVVAGAGTAAVRDTVRDGLELLAETLASALIAARTRRTLVADELVEAEITLENRLARLSAATGARCVLRRTEPAEEGSFEHTVAVAGADAETVAAFFDRTEPADTRQPTVAVAPADAGTDGADCVVRAVADDALPELLGEAGCDVRSVVAENGECRVTAGLPRERDLRRLLSTLSDRYEGVRLVAKRQPGTAGTAAAAETAAPSLTDRQREVLCAAQAMGYYEWPRERTAEAVADELGIAGSTLHQHLRTAEQKLVGAFCGTVTDDDAA